MIYYVFNMVYFIIVIFMDLYVQDYFIFIYSAFSCVLIQLLSVVNIGEKFRVTNTNSPTEGRLSTSCSDDLLTQIMTGIYMRLHQNGGSYDLLEIIEKQHDSINELKFIFFKSLVQELFTSFAGKRLHRPYTKIKELYLQ